MFKPRPSAGSRAKCEKQQQRQTSGVKRALSTWRVTQRKRILFIDNLFLFLLLKNPGPKYMTIEPDQSPLISIVFLALTLIGCESSPSPSRTYGSLAQLISIHTSLFFFFFFISYIIHSLWWQKDSLYQWHKEDKERNTAYVLSLLWKLRHIGHNAFHFHYITGF